MREDDDGSTTILGTILLVIMPRPDGGRRPAAGEDKPASGTDGSMSIFLELKALNYPFLNFEKETTTFVLTSTYAMKVLLGIFSIDH